MAILKLIHLISAHQLSLKLHSPRKPLAVMADSIYTIPTPILRLCKEETLLNVLDVQQYIFKSRNNAIL
jgi:hypothetical protein